MIHICFKLKTVKLGGVHGLFQEELLVHGKDNGICPICNTKIIKDKINGRGTYYCPNCQK